MDKVTVSFLTVFLALTLIVACVAIMIGFFRYKHLEINKFIKEENKKFAMNSSYDPESELLLLDIFIMDCFKSYQSTVLSREEISYVNDEKQVKIMQDLAKIVDDRMSDNLRYKISKYYKEEAINDVIAEKIYSAVVAFVIESNRPK